MNWFATFKVRRAALIAGVGAALFAVSLVLGVLVGIVAVADPAALGEGMWLWMWIAAAVTFVVSAICFVVAFIKLCANVEYLVREAVDRRGG